MVRTVIVQAAPGHPFGAADPNGFPVEDFDVAQTTLEAQREVAKNMAEATRVDGGDPA
jgi:hypothetical protein